MPIKASISVTHYHPPLWLSLHRISYGFWFIRFGVFIGRQSHYYFASLLSISAAKVTVATPTIEEPDSAGQHNIWQPSLETWLNDEVLGFASLVFCFVSNLQRL
jgi:hypothetical protein